MIKIRIFLFTEREKKNFRQYFKSEKSLVYCSDIPDLLKEMGIEDYNKNDWRLFIDSSKKV